MVGLWELNWTLTCQSEVVTLSEEPRLAEMTEVVQKLMAILAQAWEAWALQERIGLLQRIWDVLSDGQHHLVPCLVDDLEAFSS